MITAAMPGMLDGVQDAGREETFRRLMGQYAPALKRLARVYLAQEADREDLVQDIALAVWKAIPGFRGDASERTWLYRIAHNTAIRSATRNATRGRREGSLSDATVYPSSAPDSEEGLLTEEKRRLLFESVRELPMIDRQVVALHLEGLSYADIEGVTRLSETAIATRLSRVRGRLREQVKRKASANEPR
jgi:RNA polymerase sigma factor (sigma-70 family)